MKKIMFLAIITIVVICLTISNNNNLNNYNSENTVENTVKIKEESDFKGKNIALFGDSLIAGYGNNDNGLDYYLKKLLPKTNFANFSKSGSTISDNTGEDEIVIKNQIKNINNNPDIIIFNGGTNDIMGYCLGFLFDTNKKEIGYANNLIDDTVMSDFAETIQEAKSRFPNAKLFYVQMFSFDDEVLNHLTQNNQELINEIKTRKDQFFNEVQIVCENYGVTYIDTSNVLNETGLQYRQDDWTHINDAGYKLIANNVFDVIKNNI